ncbi:unnamed protein product [Ectocarpus sp. 4 AP-2014]
MAPPHVTEEVRHSASPDIESLVYDADHESRMPALKELLNEILPLRSWKEIEKRFIIFRRREKFVPKKNVVYHLYMAQEVRNDALEKALVSKHVRSLSGVLIVTVLTSPYPEYDVPGAGGRPAKRKVQRFSCKHNCYYCPNEPAHEGNNFVPQPRSYLHDEPGVRRANRCGFDAVLQFRDRVSSYIANGHPIDKIEILVLGGTWSEYPESYQREFCRDLFYAANTTFNERPERLTLEEEIKLNEDASTRVIGLTLETRPDVIDLDEIARLRSYGCTRLQIGVQHTDNAILKKINRGHDVEATIRCLRLLKDNCFKVDIHLMPNLPGSTVEGDVEMFDKVLGDPDLQADQWKIYPCSIVPWTVIDKWHREGSYNPYPEDQLFELILSVKVRVHPWIRLNRVIRDIPNQYITGGCSVTNMRQILLQTLAKRGLKCRCMRCREVKGQEFKDAALVVRKYKASGGTEYFISSESPEETLYGFLRLRIPSGTSPILPDLKGCALIRELHVYGKLKKVGEGGETQHQGLGTQLLARAEKIARQHGYVKMAVISGVGVRRYYERFGYRSLKDYQVKVLVDKWTIVAAASALTVAAAAVTAAAVVLARGRGGRR